MKYKFPKDSIDQSGAYRTAISNISYGKSALRVQHIIDNYSKANAKQLLFINSNKTELRVPCFIYTHLDSLSMIFEMEGYIYTIVNIEDTITKRTDFAMLCGVPAQEDTNKIAVYEVDSGFSTYYINDPYRLLKMDSGIELTFIDDRLIKFEWPS